MSALIQLFVRETHSPTTQAPATDDPEMMRAPRLLALHPLRAAALLEGFAALPETV